MGLLFGLIYIALLLFFVALLIRLVYDWVQMFARDWLPLLVVSVVGIGGFARLFTDVANAQAAEAARRESAELRAITLLARAAAHEINNALMVVAGGLAILAKHLPADSEDAQWAARAREGVVTVKNIITRMNSITQIEAVPGQGMLPPMLDIRKSSDPANS